MVTSLRDLAQQCLGVTGAFSVERDFFGHRSTRPGPLSVRLQVSLLRNPHIHLDVILVGGDEFTAQQSAEVDHAIYFTRQIFEQIPLGIGRITYHQIDVADARGLDIMTKKREAKRLTRRHRGSNDDAIDVFFPRSYNTGSIQGFGNVPGCDKDLRIVNGVVVSTGPETDRIRIRRLLAHELGHALRLVHRDRHDNLMQSGGFGVRLTEQQQRRMLRDCFVQDAH